MLSYFLYNAIIGLDYFNFMKKNYKYLKFIKIKKIKIKYENFIYIFVITILVIIFSW